MYSRITALVIALTLPPVNTTITAWPHSCTHVENRAKGYRISEPHGVRLTPRHSPAATQSPLFIVRTPN